MLLLIPEWKLKVKQQIEYLVTLHTSEDLASRVVNQLDNYFTPFLGLPTHRIPGSKIKFPKKNPKQNQKSPSSSCPLPTGSLIVEVYIFKIFSGSRKAIKYPLSLKEKKRKQLYDSRSFQKNARYNKTCNEIVSWHTVDSFLEIYMQMDPKLYGSAVGIQNALLGLPKVECFIAVMPSLVAHRQDE